MGVELTTWGPRLSVAVFRKISSGINRPKVKKSLRAKLDASHYTSDYSNLEAPIENSSGKGRQFSSNPPSLYLEGH